MSSINSLPNSSNIKNNHSIQNNPSYYDPTLAESDYFDPSLSVLTGGISSQATPTSILTAVASNQSASNNNNIANDVQSLEQQNKRHRRQMKGVEDAQQAIVNGGSQGSSIGGVGK